MTTTDRNRTAENSQARYQAMLTLAELQGCNLQRSANRLYNLQGKCPFHRAADNGHASHLTVNEQTGKFYCGYCKTQGYPVAFCAKTWGVTATDARILVDYHLEQGNPITLKRPPYPPPAAITMPDGRMLEESYPNTALFTLATRHFAENLVQRPTYPVLRYFAKMAIPPEQAAAAGIGYCAGTGLKDYLLAHDITKEEIQESPLFLEMTGAETYAGRLVFSDIDQTGATSWMFANNINKESEEFDWIPSPPGAYGLKQAMKPYLFNTKQVNQGYAAATDDPRLYTVLAAGQLPVLLMTQRKRDGQDTEIRYRKTATSLLRRNLKNVTIITHDEELPHHVAQRLHKQDPAIQVKIMGTEDILRILTPRTRDLSEIIPSKPPAKETPRN